MPHFKGYFPFDPQAQWLYCPSCSASIIFSTLFFLVTITHMIQSVINRKPFALVLVMGSLWEFLGYIFRTFSVTSQLNETYATAQQLLILLAPLWINAFVYMVLGRMIHFFLTPANDSIYRIKARPITSIFVLFDITAFLVQVVGGLMTTPDASPETQRQGLHVYMAGVGLQLFFIVMFICLAVRFQLILQRTQQTQQTHQQTDPSSSLRSSITIPTVSDDIIRPHNAPYLATPLMVTIYVVLTLIIYRNIYRLGEFSSGVESSITMHEWYTFVFDGVLMLLALLVFNIFHPGRKLKGPHCDFSEETSRMKMEKKERKDDKKAETREMKEAKMKRKDHEIQDVQNHQSNTSTTVVGGAESQGWEQQQRMIRSHDSDTKI